MPVSNSQLFKLKKKKMEENVVNMQPLIIEENIKYIIL